LETCWCPEKGRKAILVLEDKSIFTGCGFGAAGKVSGEVVFSTSMVGYPESLTDPSYHGQILTLTYPLVGNYGVPPYRFESGLPSNFESEGVKVSGLVVHELCERPHHWASTKTLGEWLKNEGVPGIYGIDTRMLTKKLRVRGVMLGTLQVYEEEADIEGLLKEVESIPDPNSRNLVKEVSTREPIRYESKGRNVVVLIDCGVKYGILRELVKRGLDVIRVPYDFLAEEVMEYNPSGVVVSNGPGDPKRCDETIHCVRELVEENVPVMGICLGNQILALASGADTYKMKYGHRSQNQPALDLETNRCYITTQNHGYAVDLESMQKTDSRVWFMNANDKTVEGIRNVGKKAFAVQFHPEATPGPYDTTFLFDQFVECAGM